MPTGRCPRVRIRRDNHHDNPPPLRLRKRHEEPDGSLATELRQGGARAYTRAVRRDRRLDADQDAGRPDLGILCGRKPVRTEIAGLLLTFHQDLRMRSR